MTATVTRVKLAWEVAYATAYRTETSTGATTWNTVSTSSGNVATDDITGLATSGR